MHADEYWIWLSKVKISVISKRTLVEIFRSPKKIYNLEKRKLSCYLEENECIEVLKKEYKNNLYDDLQYIRKHNIKLINIMHNYYPKSLKDIYDAPILLYAIGNIQRLKEKSIAIVGARECSEYGKRVARNIAKELVKHKINTISGLAKGIDAEAHKGAKGNTIAVLGSGLNIIYPSININLAKEIIYRGGLIITEYELGAKPDRLHFPSRNRIISGISNGVVVVEAKKRSGSLITADFALEQGKDVYAVPGNITSINSQGTNNLIKEGAIPYTQIEDIIENFKL